MNLDRKPILIGGPTASGKTALAIQIARAVGGVVINADSQQIYRDWQVLTARPTAEEEAEVPHHLFGHVALDQDYSVGHWLREVAPLMAECAEKGLSPVIAGGTGLYFKGLTEGLAPIPEIPPEVRARGEAEQVRVGTASFAEALAARDPDTARDLALDNPRRVLRAWEVLEATDIGLAAWKARTPAPMVPLAQATTIALNPPRDWLYARCEARFDQMLDAGALDEARAVMAMALPATAPGLRALGAPELMSYLRGEISLDEAKDRAKTETRRYAKRQLTWQRNQMSNWQTIDPSHPDHVEYALDLID